MAIGLAVDQAPASPPTDAASAVPFSLPEPVTTGSLKTLRLFSEPLVPLTTAPAAADNAALAAALRSFAEGRDPAVLEAFVKANPASPWSASVLVNVGLKQFDAGYYGRALQSWTQAWNLGKDAAEPAPIVLRGLAEALKMNCRVGRMDDAKALLAQLGDRKASGLNATMIEESRKAIGQMETMPAECFKCGPFALSSILAHTKKHTAETYAKLNAYATTPQGTSLSMVTALANEQFGMKMQAAKRVSKDAAILLPAVINWKLNHYGALLEAKDGLYLMTDPTFGTSQWIGQDAIDEESSGYFVVPAGDLPEGWQAVEAAEADTIWGRGDCATGDGNGTGKGAPKKGGKGGCGKGMAQWAIHHSLASLNIEDIPLFYDPPAGPPVYFRVNYSQLEQNQPTTINFSNLGPLWNLSWVSYLTFDSGAARLRSGEGGTELYTRFNSSTNTYDPEQSSHARLVKISATNYERRDSDGSKMVFDLDDGTGRLFMTKIVDPQGNALTMSYDANFRLVSVTDAVGQVTTLTHGSNTPGNPQFYIVTAVSDPFGRSAALTYDVGNRLTAVQDQIGIISAFNYDANGKVNSLTTPYGTTTFDCGNATVPVKGVISWVEVTEPNGAKERVESLQYSTTPASDPVVPAGIPLVNQYMNFRNSYYWDPKAMQVGAGDYTKANLTHFQHLNISAIKASVIESEKDPLESRIWYFYQNQVNPIFTNEGMGANPTHVARLLDDGSTQLERYSYNDLGNVTQSIDPLGRTTNYTYAANGIDLLAVKQVNAQGGEDLLATFTWNSQHLPVTITNASGAVTTFTYNARGQVTSVTNALGQSASYVYNAQGYLISADGPLPGTGDQSTFTYDAVGRTNTVTNGDGYTLDFDYDALDRVTKVTYPDGSFEQITYTNLDATQMRDRMGRITTMTYDSMQQLVSSTDPLNRVIKLDWCQCGSLRRIIDPLGRVTTWDEDVQGRTTSKTFPDGAKELYQYEATNSRLARVTDAKGQSKVFSYNLDDSTASITYLGAFQPTPGISFAYDSAYPRPVSITDGLGLTTFSYGAVTGSSAGANLLKKTQSHWNGVEITFSHDALGRVTTRAINGVPQTVTRDVAGRVSSLSNGLGSFGFSYDAASGRITNVSMPNGQSITASYFGNAGDRRLQQLRNVQPNASTLSQFDYTYNIEGQITSWNQQSSGNPALNFNLGYDAARQLTTMTSASRIFGYGYDLGGNLQMKQFNADTTLFTHNILNELQTAVPPIGADKTYLWDAEDRLVQINYTGTNLATRLKYDGAGRCVEITEHDGSTVTSTKRFIWCGFERCEERDASGNVTRRFFPQGEQINGQNYFYAFDHLGSVREMTDGSGAIRARYDYDPYGVRTKLAGDLDASFGFTGHYFHAGSGLHLTLFRAYDAQTGRWLSRDPLGEEAGMNLYAYVGGSPVDRIDPFGLVDWSGAAFAGAGVIGNGFGMLGGAAFATATGVSGVGAFVGGAVAVKSAYGVGANLANLGAALMEREDGPYSNGSLFNDAAGWAAPGNDTAQALATAADLSLDLGAGRMAAGLKAAPFGPFVGAARGKTFVGDKSDDMLGALGGLSAAQAGAGVAGFIPPSPPKPGAKPKTGNGKAGAKPTAGKNKAKPKPAPGKGACKKK